MTTLTEHPTAPEGTGPQGTGLDRLAAAVTGRLLTAADEGYAALVVPWNVAAASRPVAVLEAAGPADVVAAVRFANDAALDVVVQATGHGAWVYERPTLLIATARLDTIEIDPASRIARIGAGVRWQQVLDAAAVHGLSGLCGSAPNVGVVGYTTGGGLSPIGRSFGYAADRVVAFDVVTGDGVLRRATATENPALFWGLRGGKGALGVVTAMEFELLPIAELFGGSVFFDAEHIPTVLSAWRRWAATLPEQASTSFAILRLPPLPDVPPPLAGKTTATVRFGWIGDPDEGARTFAAVQQAAPVLLGGAGVLPMTAFGELHRDPVDPMPVCERAILLRELTDDAADALLAVGGPDSSSPLVITELRLLGGALTRPPAHPSAVCHRDAAYSLMGIGVLAPPIAEASLASAAALVDALEPWSGGASQPNFGGGGDDPAKAARNWDDATLARLATLAATYDPRGVLAASRSIRQACAARD